MRHRSSKKILGRVRARRRGLYRHLAISLIMHGRIITTEAKAKAVRPFVEKLVSVGRTSTLSSRRELLRKLANDPATRKILTNLGPKYASRPGGYTRIVKLGRRIGDAAPEALLEFVQ